MGTRRLAAIPPSLKEKTEQWQRFLCNKGGRQSTSRCETRRSCLQGQRRRTPLTGPTGCIRATWCSVKMSERQRSDHMTSGVGFSKRVNRKGQPDGRRNHDNRMIHGDVPKMSATPRTSAPSRIPSKVRSQTAGNLPVALQRLPKNLLQASKSDRRADAPQVRQRSR